MKITLNQYAQKYLLALGVLFTLVISSCGPNKVVSFYVSKNMPKSDNTYFIRTVDKSNTLFFNAIDSAVRDQMEARSFSYSSINPDVVLTFQVSSNSRTEINNNNALNFVFPTFPTANNVHELFLFITMKNRKGKLIWQGSQELRSAKRKEREEDVFKESVGYIFETFQN